MTFLLGKDRFEKLKKKRLKLVLLCLLPSLAYIALVVAFFLTSNRGLMHLYPILLSIVSTIYFSYLLFYFVIILRSHLRMKQLCLDALNKRLFEGEVVVFSIDQKTTTIRGIQFNALDVIQLDDEEHLIIHVLEEEINNFSINKKYRIRILQSILVAFEEIDDE